MVFFRVDSNSIIAGGHIMRCLAISKELVKTGISVHFLVADENPITVLKEAGVEYTVLCSDWQNLMSDVKRVKEIIQGEELPVIVIDTYSVTREYVDYLKPYAKIVYLGSKQTFLGDLSLLINYSAYIDYGFYHSYYPRETTLLLGVCYAPLREEFRSVNKEYRNRIQRILLTTGNTDKMYAVNAIINALLPLITETRIVIDVVVGRMFDYKGHLHKEYDGNHNVRLHENANSMSLLMKECDLAISANGTTVYELSAVGVPTITFAIASEQIKSAEALSKLGVVDYCGRLYENQERCIAKIYYRVNYYLEHNDELIELARKAHAYVDGNGCNRIVNEIRKLR